MSVSEIPSGWSKTRIKYISSVQAGYAFKSELFTTDNTYIPLIRIRDITTGRAETFYSGPYDNSYVVSNGDLLVGMDGDFNVRWWNGGTAILNQRCLRINPPKTVLKKFLYYAIQLPLKKINDLTYFTTVKHLSNEDVLNIAIIFPGPEEQKAIVDFLDKKCAEIDKLSEDIQKQIEILEDYKKSVITRAVTKGLNPNAEMKDRGIKWIGKIPASWDIAPLKSFLDDTPNAIVDGPFGSDMKNEEYVSDGVPVIQLGSIRDYRMDFSKMHFITDEKADSLKRHNAFPQDVVIAKMMPAGKACEVPDKYTRYVVSADVIRIIISNEPIRRYIIYALNCCAIVQAEIESQGSTRARVNINKVKHFKIPKPPEESIQLVVDYLDKKCAIIESSIEVKKKQLNDLGVYKKSIIYEYVTGKKRVKGAL